MGSEEELPPIYKNIKSSQQNSLFYKNSQKAKSSTNLDKTPLYAERKIVVLIDSENASETVLQKALEISAISRRTNSDTFVLVHLSSISRETDKSMKRTTSVECIPSFLASDDKKQKKKRKDYMDAELHIFDYMDGKSPVEMEYDEDPPDPFEAEKKGVDNIWMNAGVQGLFGPSRDGRSYLTSGVVYHHKRGKILLKLFSYFDSKTNDAIKTKISVFEEPSLVCSENKVHHFAVLIFTHDPKEALRLLLNSISPKMIIVSHPNNKKLIRHLMEKTKVAMMIAKF